ncbi:MAG TPA: aminoglycoside phosphotransferase family protein [Gaiellaceae bacterium]|nr:aminoglycoside phosphotransferase family protein [Gaiellaceae bacterium]
MAGAGLTHADWLARVPTLLAETATAWGLTPGEPYPAGAAGLALRADLPDGTPAVLKLSYPHRESEQEADALERWDGDGAVRLLARDDARHALLLERCDPGTFLSEWDGDALGVLIELLPRLWKSGDGFTPLAEEAEWWLEHDVAEIRDRRLREAAVHYLRELAPTQGEQVLLHQDLHGDNVLAARREPWLVIDPKPLAGERAFSAASIVRSHELGHSKRDVLYRLDRLCAELGLDRERARGWTIAQTVAWSGGSDYVAPHVETVHWLLEDA